MLLCNNFQLDTPNQIVEVALAESNILGQISLQKRNNFKYAKKY